MSKEVIGASVEIEYKSIGEMRKALKEGQSEVIRLQQQFGATSQEAINAAKRVADLKDRIQDAAETVDLFDPGNKFKALTGTVQVAAQGFTALQGAMGLLGVESKEVEKQLLRVQSAMALSQSLSALADSRKEFDRLGSIIKNKVVTAFSTLRGAIISTGIGALVVALGALIANFDKIKNAIDGVSDAQKDLVDQTTKAADKEAEKLETLDSQDNVLKLQGKSETQILEIKKKQIGEIIEARRQQLIAFKELREQQIAGAKRNKEILQGILDFITAPLRLLQSVGGKIAGFLGLDNIEAVFQRLNAASLEANNRISEYFFNIEDATAETDAKIKEIEKDLKDLENRQAGLVLTQQKIAKDERKKKEDEAKKLAEERELLRKELAEQKVKDLQAEADAEAKWLEQQKKINADKEEQRQKELDEAAERERKRQEDRIKMQLEYNQALLAAEEDLQNAKFQAVSAGLDLIGSLAGKNRAISNALFAVDKGLAIAKIVIDLQKEIAGYYANPTWKLLPDGGIGLATAASAKAKIRAAISIASVAAATIQKYMGGAGSGGGLVGGGSTSISTSAPLTAGLPTTAQAQLVNAQAINQQGNQAVQAFVLNSDIQNNNQINAFLRRNARI